MIYSMENLPCLALIHSPQSQCYLGDIIIFQSSLDLDRASDWDLHASGTYHNLNNLFV